MNHASSNDADRDFDVLVAGRPVNDPDLAALAPMIAALRTSAAATAPSDAQAKAMAASLAAAVVPEGGAAPTAVRRSPWRRRVGASVAVAGVLGLGFAGAAAADGAAPGDALYGLDRALERVGINAGGADERLGEVRTLVERGDVDMAADLATETLHDLDHVEAADGLRVAATSVLAEGSEQSLENRARVSEMLLWMADQDQRGAEFGQAVSEFARGLTGAPAEGDDGSDDAQGGEAVAADAGSVPAPAKAGRPETAGQPADPGAAGGSPVTSGENGGAQAPSGVGTPATPGEDSDGGAPTDAGRPADRATDAGGPTDAGRPADAGTPADRASGAGTPADRASGAGKPAGSAKPDQASSSDAGAPAGGGKPAGKSGKP